MNKTLVAAFAVLLVVGGLLTIVTGAVLYQRSHEDSLGEFSGIGTPTALKERDASWLTEFTLTERTGRDFHSRDLDGQVRVTSFFFASCPSACRMQNEQVRELCREFGARGVTFISITCDPEADTPAVLSQYADLYNADPKQWLFLTGDLTYIRRIAGEIFEVQLDKQTHSEKLIVVDRAGKVRGRFHWNNPDQIAEMRQTLEKLLTEAPPPDEPPKAE